MTYFRRKPKYVFFFNFRKILYHLKKICLIPHIMYKEKLNEEHICCCTAKLVQISRIRLFIPPPLSLPEPFGL